MVRRAYVVKHIAVVVCVVKVEIAETFTLFKWRNNNVYMCNGPTGYRLVIQAGLISFYLVDKCLKKTVVL